MTPEKQTLLQNKYPKIFKKSEYETEPMDLWGFECNDGWFEIIDTLCSRIQKHVDRRISNIQDPEEAENLQVVAQQVKEKFGGLRFYYRGGDNVIGGMLQMAESMSYVTCENCGKFEICWKSAWNDQEWFLSIWNAPKHTKNFQNDRFRATEKFFELATETSIFGQ
jgi:hypothetical protein